MHKIKYWIIRADSDKYRSFNSIGRNENNEIEKVNCGYSLSENWFPENTAFYTDEKGKENKKNIADFMRFQGIAINEKAKTILAPIISDSVEFLPIITQIDSYWLLNISVIDCLDQEKSQVKLYSSGRIMAVLKYAFYEERLPDTNIFVLPVGIDVIITEKFKKVYDENKLTGLHFRDLPI